MRSGSTPSEAGFEQERREGQRAEYLVLRTPASKAGGLGWRGTPVRLVGWGGGCAAANMDWESLKKLETSVPVAFHSNLHVETTTSPTVLHHN